MIPMFQFHTGSIKSVIDFTNDIGLVSFNSILVRLKEDKESEMNEVTMRFQFHTGSIKRREK